MTLILRTVEGLFQLVPQLIFTGKCERNENEGRISLKASAGLRGRVVGLRGGLASDP